MTMQELNVANDIKRQIEQINNFIWYAGKVKNGTLISEKQRYLMRTISWGYLDTCELELDVELKGEIVKLLEDRLKELNNRLESMGIINE